jgi:hypothetical protein
LGGKLAATLYLKFSRTASGSSPPSERVASPLRPPNDGSALSSSPENTTSDQTTTRYHTILGSDLAYVAATLYLKFSRTASGSSPPSERVASPLRPRASNTLAAVNGTQLEASTGHRTWAAATLFARLLATRPGDFFPSSSSDKSDAARSRVATTEGGRVGGGVG